jgi:hypothetical protein
MGLGAFGWRALTDRFGSMAVVLSGGFLLGLGVALASRATGLLAESSCSTAAWRLMLGFFRIAVRACGI